MRTVQRGFRGGDYDQATGAHPSVDKWELNLDPTRDLEFTKSHPVNPNAFKCTDNSIIDSDGLSFDGPARYPFLDGYSQSIPHFANDISPIAHFF